MKIILRNIFFVLIALVLTACSTTETETPQNKKVNVALPPVTNEEGLALAPVNPAPPTNVPIGGKFVTSMDRLDKAKLSRALDKATGKTTEWSNPITQIDYAVTPVKKVVINGSSCRQYKIEATKSGNTQEFDGTACISPDGNWQETESQ